jgi:hypothetical protein
MHVHLKSLSKFYYTLSDPSPIDPKPNQLRGSNRETNLTVQSLVELAKDVSDKMILNKLRVNKQTFLI